MTGQSSTTFPYNAIQTPAKMVGERTVMFIKVLINYFVFYPLYTIIHRYP